MIQVFKGKEIDIDKIEKIRNIAYKKYNQNIYEEYFSNIQNVNDLARMHDVKVSAESLVLGTDWFLCYTESTYYLQISEWISTDTENKMQQSIEMLNMIKKIMIQNKRKLFVADMRHDTSYAIYSKMLQKGYFDELMDELILDCAAPEYVYELKQKLMDNFDSIESFLLTNQSKEYEEYFKYILHRLSFIVTDKFIQKYVKPTEKAELKVKKKNRYR